MRAGPPLGITERTADGRIDARAIPYTKDIAPIIQPVEGTSLITRSNISRFLAVFATALILTASVAEARGGRGGSFGSRGSRTFQAPPVTQTAPRPAAPIERSVTQPGNPGVSQAARSPAAARGPAGFFANRGGFFGGMMAGLLGAGLFGLLFGSGLFGGLGGLASILGLLLQVALVVFLARLAFRYFQRRNQPAYAGAVGSYAREASAAPGPMTGPASGSARPGVRREPISLQKSDYDAFEGLLGVIQTGYGQGDRQALQTNATPEVAAIFEQELAENEARGVVNHVSEPKLLQGDLAEAWREGDSEYATVAMRFSLRDHTTERASGRVVEGDPDRPTEATEVWTFTRPRGGRWVLSAIQQA